MERRNYRRRTGQRHIAVSDFNSVTALLNEMLSDRFGIESQMGQQLIPAMCVTTRRGWQASGALGVPGTTR
jgi:hypothetical protein